MLVWWKPGVGFYYLRPLSADAIIIASDTCFMVECYHKLIRQPPVVRSCHSHYTYNHKFVVETLSIRIKGISFNKSLQRKSFCRITSAFECDAQTRTFPFIMKVLKMYDACWQIRNFSFLRPAPGWTFFTISRTHIWWWQTFCCLSFPKKGQWCCDKFHSVCWQSWVLSKLCGLEKVISPWNS